jgi:hypothetical protein
MDTENSLIQFFRNTRDEENWWEGISRPSETICKLCNQETCLVLLQEANSNGLNINDLEEGIFNLSPSNAANEPLTNLIYACNGFRNLLEPVCNLCVDDGEDGLIPNCPYPCNFAVMNPRCPAGMECGENNCCYDPSHDGIGDDGVVTPDIDCGLIHDDLQCTLSPNCTWSYELNRCLPSGGDGGDDSEINDDCPPLCPPAGIRHWLTDIDYGGLTCCESIAISWDYYLDSQEEGISYSYFCQETYDRYSEYGCECKYCNCPGCEGVFD